MKNQKVRKIMFIGLGFVIFGLLCNVHVLSLLFSRDGITSIYSKMGIWITQALLISTGFLIIFKRKEIDFVCDQVRVRFRNKVFMIIFLLMVLIIGFAIPELLMRLFKPQLTYSRLMKLVKAGIYAPSEFNPFTLKANVRTVTSSMEHPGEDVEVAINSLGLRGEEIALKKPQGIKRILILGDSYTYGVYVANDETYPAVLERLYKERDERIQVINAGYADGWAPDEHYVWLINRGLAFEPDVIVYGFFIGNDLSDTMDLEWQKLDKRGLPTKIVNSKIHVDEDGIIRSAQKDQKTAGVTGIYRIPILRESHFLVFLCDRLEGLLSKSKTDVRHRGWGEDPFPFIFKETNDAEMTYQEGRFKKVVLGMAEAAQKNNSNFLVLMIPINFQVDEAFLSSVLGSDKFSIKRNYFEELKPWLEENNIRHLDLLKAMKASGEHYFPLNGEVHFNPQGHGFAAKKIRIELDRLGWGQGL